MPRESVHAHAVYTWHLHLLQQPCRLGHVVIALWSIDASDRRTYTRTRTRTHSACLPQHAPCVPADGLQLRARGRDAVLPLGASPACGLSKHGRLTFRRGPRRAATQPHLVCTHLEQRLHVVVWARRAAGAFTRADQAGHLGVGRGKPWVCKCLSRPVSAITCERQLGTLGCRATEGLKPRLDLRVRNRVRYALEPTQSRLKLVHRLAAQTSPAGRESRGVG